MKRIAILVPQNAVMEGITGPRYLFSAANQFLQAAGKDPLFEISLVGDRREIKTQDGVYTISTDMLISQSRQYDLVVIPPLFGDMDLAIDHNKESIPWIKEQYQNGAEVASLCVGAFLLASTGLLDGRKCSTHWAFYNAFRARFPEVEIVNGSVITEEGRIYSSGGAHSLWNLLLYLLEKYTDREMAIQASKYFAIDIGRDSQASFMMFTGQKMHEDVEIREAQTYIESNYSRKISVDELANKTALSRRSFERRFQKATHNTTIEYLQRVRVEAAKRHFETTRKNIAEVMYDVGYSDSKAFRNVFKKITGLSPVHYRKKYNKKQAGENLINNAPA